MIKALRPCKQPGCPELVERGYCPEHQPIVTEMNKQENIQNIRALDRKKSKREVAFYNSPAWRKTSKLYRVKHPLCERCVSRGIYNQESELVHHKKELRDIWKDNGNPLRWSYLEGLCHNCHMEDFRAKRIRKKIVYQY